jgi:glycosyltransferase involved in cell wall biosynthesis
MKITLVSVAPPYRGGISLLSAVLFKHLKKRHTINCVNFSRQYPSLLFPGKTQLETGTPAVDIPSKRTIDSINPLTWITTANSILDNKPDLVIFRYWHPFFAILMGIIARRLKKKSPQIKLLAICDNITPHESHFYDRYLTRYFLKSMDSYIVMSKSVENDLKTFIDKPTYKLLHHPLYNVFGELIDKQIAKEKIGINKNNIILYFGYVRAYKGLDVLIKSASILKDKLDDFHIIAVGESYEGTQKYMEMIDQYDVNDVFTWITEYVPDSQVSTYFSAADVVALPYKTATQSGIVNIAYHFNKPVVVTNVGGLPDIVENGKSGFVIEPNNPKELAEILIKNINSNKFIEMTDSVEKYKHKFSWEVFVKGIEDLVEEL